MEKPPIINSHTHIFTGNHVPPYLAKTVLPFPLYYLVNLQWFVNAFRRYYKLKSAISYSPLAKRYALFKNKFIQFANLFGVIKSLIIFAVTVQVLFILFRYLSKIMDAEEGFFLTQFNRAYNWLTNANLIVSDKQVALQILLILFLFLFIPSGRNFILFIFSKFWSFLGIFSNKNTKALFQRYVNIGRYAFHQKQNTIFSMLKGQYPVGTGFVVLPMDMAYMGAGAEKEDYYAQMKELASIKSKNKNTFFPFVFADPRRMKAEPNYFKYNHKDGKVTLENCFVKDYIEENKFSGFKIYPALGYYAFDETLLPLWKYAADNGLPITTHCIRGTIYYRGSKQNDWNFHPVFEQANGYDNYSPLLLPEMKNEHFSWNFTHPLNYLCLLDERLLRKLIANASDHIKALFGFTNSETKLKYDLSNLKICFAHFGGDDEWHKYFERDRYNFSNRLIDVDSTGINFMENADGEFKRGKLEMLWKSADWYSIITSLMLQYPNVYADISYILHDETALLPLLKQTLNHPKLKYKVLFGTDFYVVRNHKSDKEMLADMMCGLSEVEFDLIARENPKNFIVMR